MAGIFWEGEGQAASIVLTMTTTSLIASFNGNSNTNPVIQKFTPSILLLRPAKACSSEMPFTALRVLRKGFKFHNQLIQSTLTTTSSTLTTTSSTITFTSSTLFPPNPFPLQSP